MRTNISLGKEIMGLEFCGMEVIFSQYYHQVIKKDTSSKSEFIFSLHLQSPGYNVSEVKL